MAPRSDYVTGTVTLTNGSTAFTGAGTAWALAGFREGDEIKQVAGQTQWEAMVATIDSNTAGTLVRPWGGATGTYAYRMRFQPDGSRVTAQARELIELLGDGTLLSLAGLGGAGVIELLPGGGAQVVPKTDLVSGAAYDVQVANLAGRAAYDGQAAGFSVLVANVGDGRAAIYSKITSASGNWSAAAYVTGPVGPTVTITAGNTVTLAPGTAATFAVNPVTGGYALDAGIPAGRGAKYIGAYSGATVYVRDDAALDNGSTWILTAASSTGNAPPTLPTTSNAYWQLLARKGTDGTGTGDFVGPVSAVNNRIVAFDGTTGKLGKDSGLLTADVMLKSTVIANAQAMAGQVVDSVSGATATYIPGGSVIPIGGAAPSNTAGDSIITATITPKSATNKIRVRALINCTRGITVGNILATLTRTGASTAIGVAVATVTQLGAQHQLSLNAEFTPGGVSALTIAVRIGPGDAGGIMFVNGNDSTGFFGGAWASWLVVEEIKA